MAPKKPGGESSKHGKKKDQLSERSGRKGKDRDSDRREAVRGDNRATPVGGKPSPRKSKAPASQPFDLERTMRAIHKILEGREFASVEEREAFLKEHFVGRKVDEILAEYQPGPAEQAQELAFRAMATDNDREAERLCRMALELDPENVDAALVLADRTAETLDEVIERTRRIVSAAEQRFDDTFMERNRGRLWSILEARPCLRGLAQLRSLLEMAGEHEESIRVGERLLSFDTDDNQRVRCDLLPLYLRLGRLDEARELLQRFEDDSAPTFLFGRALERFLSGSEEEAFDHLREAHDANPHLIGFLTGEKRAPRRAPPSYTPGSEEEAIVAWFQIAPAWQVNPEALVWLKRSRVLPQ